MEEQYLTVRQVAERLQVTRQAVYNWINEGRIKAVKLGKSVRIPVSSLLAFMQPVKSGELIEDDESGNWAPELLAA
jgi:excisionase family DNA binding protein